MKSERLRYSAIMSKSSGGRERSGMVAVIGRLFSGSWAVGKSEDIALCEYSADSG